MTHTASPPSGNPALDAALAYAGLGLRVVPIEPGKKAPRLAAWQKAATTDRATIENWWTNLYRDHGVGIALGELEDFATVPTYVFAVDIDGDSHGVDGEAAWTDACAGREVPDTWEAITGGGGRHLLFSANVEVRNGKLADGVDIRGAGGQIVAEPTVHPSGQRYAWADGAAPWERPVAPAPAWLIDALQRPVEPPRAPQAATGDVGSRPGDLWAAQTPWSDLLGRDGWTYDRTGRDGEERWVRPGKDKRDGISATVNYRGSDVLKVFTSSVPHLAAEQTYTKLGYLAATRHGGDHSAAASWLASQGYRTDELDGWVDVVAETPAAGDLTPGGEVGAPEGWPIASADEIDAVLSGDYEPPRPEIITRSDGCALLYRGKVHSLAGEPGGGKTLFALHGAVEVLDAGGTVVVVDHEDRLDTAVRRLVALGAAPDAIRARFRYVSPTFAIVGGGVPTNVLEASVGADLVIIDSMGEALAHDQLDQNKDDEVSAWMSKVARRLADGGAAVLLIDHVIKDSEHRGRWAIGSQRKLAAIDGASYTVTTRKALSRTESGHLLVKCSKDRLGNYQHDATVADVRLVPRGDDISVSVAPPTTAGPDGSELLTGYMERISRFLEEMGAPMSGRAIEASVSGKGVHIRTALRQLIELGHVEVEGAGRAVIHRSVRPFREDDDLLDGAFASRVPNASQRVPDAVEAFASRVPAFKGDADAIATSADPPEPPRPRDADWL